MDLPTLVLRILLQPLGHVTGQVVLSTGGPPDVLLEPGVVAPLSWTSRLVLPTPPLPGSTGGPDRPAPGEIGDWILGVLMVDPNP